MERLGVTDEVLVLAVTFNTDAKHFFYRLAETVESVARQWFVFFLVVFLLAKLVIIAYFGNALV